MSTKALEMLVEKAEDRAFREVHGSAMAEAARKELEAIKRAAKAWGSAPEDTCPEETTAVLLSIARELP